MRPASTFKKLTSKLFSSSAGNITIMTALLAPVIFAAAGIAVDYARITSMRSKMAQALDAAVLYAGRDLTNGAPVDDTFRARFDQFFYANIQGTGGDPSAYTIRDFVADPDTGEVSARADRKVQASLLQAIGYKDTDVSVTSSSIFEQTDVEVAVMLDTTGSMSGAKLNDLKSAAEDLVDTLLPANRESRGMRISLVPYAGSVNLGNSIGNTVFQAGKVKLQTTTPEAAGFSSRDKHGFGQSNFCATDRGGAHRATDASFRVAPIGNDERTRNRNFRCPQNAALQPLTDRRSDLLDTIGSLAARGVTAGHLGIAWSYYTLSENWRGEGLWPSENDPAVYSKDTKKIAILMTDGEFNTFYHNTTGANASSAFNQTPKSNTLAEDLCDNMKAQKAGAPGILIYSIAFKAPKSAEKTLRNCANEDTQDTTYYYSAQSGEELRAAFKAIAASISNLRIKS